MQDFFRTRSCLFAAISSSRKIRGSLRNCCSNQRSGIRQRNSQRKKQELGEKSSLESVDLLSQFLSFGHSYENFVTDIVISFILAGRDTTSAGLTWFFWLISRHPDVENEILKEINEKSKDASFKEVKDMVYTYASLSESMRLYPPVPIDSKKVIDDDVLPDGTVIKKGTSVAYHPYAMGRSEKLWGRDWAEFRLERWLEKRDKGARKWSFVGKGPIHLSGVPSWSEDMPREKKWRSCR
ncbi:Cytochrome P450 94A1 [Camellia lanceoleosa]|nr:Cytochrome P450 94A1 [Camellia lanceoleosa]